MQIPVYRAKKMRSDEYIMGLVSEAIQTPNGTIVYVHNKDETCDVDPSTLAIHFPDMLGKDGVYIFASLNEDGRGGDNIDLGYNYLKTTMTLKEIFSYKFDKAVVTGIRGEGAKDANK